MGIYDVNGKVPLSVWVPSLDDAGNGTTTLNDLAGTNQGTLTNMVPASDWVADSVSSGVRALSFDGVNDHVAFASSSFAANMAQLSMSAWIRRPMVGTLGPFFGLGNGTATNRIEIQPWNDNLLYVTFTSSIYAWISLDQNWHHYAVVYDGTQTGNSNRLKIYRDGVLQTASFVGTIPATVGSASLTPRIGLSHAGSYGAGRVDDLRLFSALLDASDVTFLAQQRGVVTDQTTGSPNTHLDVSDAGWAAATLPTIFAPGNEWSIEVFADVRSFPRSWICSVNSAAGVVIAFFSTDLARLSFGTGTGWNTYAFSKGLWRFVFDNDPALVGRSKFRVFRNGVAQATIAGTGGYGAPDGGTGVTNFGRRTTGFSGTENPLNGVLSRIKIWNRRCLPTETDQTTGLVVDLAGITGVIWNNAAGSPNFSLQGGAMPVVIDKRSPLSRFPRGATV